MRHVCGVKGRYNRRLLPGAALGASAALLCLVLAACGQGASATPRATATVTATATNTPSPTPMPALTVLQPSGPPVNGITVAWRHANLPAGFGMASHVSDLHVAASDGMTAYSCGMGGAGHTLVIVTHDRGASWQRVTDAPVWNGGCQMIAVDALNPRIVVCCSYGNTPGGQAISMDGGATWRIAGGSYGIERLATAGSRTYAVLASSASGGFSETLDESDDGMRTWRRLDSTLNSSNYRALWVNPANGALLLETWPNGMALELWSTTNNGQQWTRIPLPIQGAVDFRVQQPTTAQLWHICAAYFASSGDSTISIACTTDAGQTWTQEPALLPPSGAAYEEMVGMPADGSLLVVATASSGRVLYRLPARATRWQAVGPPPTDSNGGLMYAPSDMGGCLWSFAAESDGAGGADAADAVYSATYPY